MNFANYVINKINEVVADPYSIKELSTAKLQNADEIKSSDLLSLQEVDGYYDLYLSNPYMSSVTFRIFHLSASKNIEALDLFQKFEEKLVVLCKSSSRCYVTSTLQNICTLIRTRYIWSPAHIAVEAGLKDVYGKDKFLSEWINSQSCELDYTPLHIACQLNDDVIVSALISGGADLSKIDDKGNTAFHLSVSINADKVLPYLCEAANEDILNVENHDGETALHIAAKLDLHCICKLLLSNGSNPLCSNSIGLPLHYALKYKCNKSMKVLVEHDPNQVNIACKKHGGVPLHWCKEKEQVDFLYKFHTPTEILSNASHLPLHIMVLRGRLEAAEAVILGSAKINGKGRHGNTALHLAVLHDYVMLVKMLILFGGDYNIANDFGETPGIMALRSTKPNKETIVEMLSLIGGITITPSPIYSPIKQNNNKALSGFKLLCLDGGGIRGLVSAQILMSIERICGKPSKQLFDWIAGTSTGGVLAIALAQGRNAIEVQKLYFRFKDHVFVGSRPYRSEPFEEFLKQEFGENTTMADISDGPKVIVTTTLADRKPMQLHLFRNYDETGFSDLMSTRNISKKVESFSAISKLQEKMPSLSQPLWKVARCSGSAPTYFRPIDGCLDGGLIANNPTLDALTEIHRYCKVIALHGKAKPAKEVGMVLSIGTGISKTTLARSVDVFRPTNPLSLVNSARAGLELSQMLIEVTTETSAHVVDRARSWCEMIDAIYYRLNPMIDDNVYLDEKDDTKLLNILWETHLYIYHNFSLIEEIAQMLM